jgi:hypothetical protein
MRNGKPSLLEADAATSKAAGLRLEPSIRQIAVVPPMS